MKLDRFEWLAQRKESAIDPDRVIVDPHHHLWDRGGSTYLAPQLLADITGSHNVSKTVFVECMADYLSEGPDHMRPVGEVGFVAAEADATDKTNGPVIAGIVGHADLMLGSAVDEVLAAQDAVSGGRFRGIRHATGWDASDQIRDGHSRPFEAMMLRPEFTEGARTLARMGFSFDAWLFHPQLPELASLARSVPELTIILNHLGGPLGIGPYQSDREAVREHWRAGMVDVAANTNVVLKLGGIGMDMYYGTNWTKLPIPPGSEEVAKYWRDDIGWCIEQFGPDRCMFESNFPVDRQCLTYPVLWNALQILASSYSDDEQDHMFSGTATRAYQLS